MNVKSSGDCILLRIRLQATGVRVIKHRQAASRIAKQASYEDYKCKSNPNAVFFLPPKIYKFCSVQESSPGRHGRARVGSRDLQPI